MSIREQGGVDFKHILQRLPDRDKRGIQNHLDKQKREATKHINVSLLSGYSSSQLSIATLARAAPRVHAFIFALVLSEMHGISFKEAEQRF